jgi:hypothetical protein
MERIIGFLQSRSTLFVSGLIGLGVVAVLLVLVLPAILRPPAELGPDYDIFNERMAGSTIEPDQDNLVELAESGVAVFIPANSIRDRGQFLLKERRADLVPFRNSGDYSRELAIDLLFVNPEGNVQTSYPLNDKLLLCFNLDPVQQAESSRYNVQVFDEQVEPPEWLELVAAPGWQADQVCGLVEHLSLFALARSSEGEPEAPSKSVATPDPAITVIPPELYQPPELEQ